MSKTICVINGHPDAGQGHFIDAICAHYTQAAEAAGHIVLHITPSELDFAFLRAPADFQQAPGEPVLTQREKIHVADHVVIAYPLWLGTMPAMLKAFLEQASCGSFFIGEPEPGARWPSAMMKGRSARVMVTMGMPGLAYKLLFGAHSLKATEQGILKMAGFGPVRHNVFGMVEAKDPAGRERVLRRVERLGEGGL